MYKINLSLLLWLIVGTYPAHAVRISGTVIYDEDREPATGATISAYDSADNLTGGTAAGIDGKFDLDIPDNSAVVKISLVGQTTQTFRPSELNGRTIALAQNPILLGEAVVTGRYTGGDGCSNAENDRITPELALCSVHAYNIGESRNPSGSNKQLMKDVIALKTTVITQQMNKQYEYLDSMIRRFKTQLEKAVLTTKLQAAGAVQ